jgi:hypothetical protein
MIHSDIDPAQLLDIAIEQGERLSEEIESYGEDVVFHEEEVSVTYKGQIQGGTHV